MAERRDFWKDWNGNLMAQKFAAVLDERATDPIRKDLAGYESYMYGKGYIRFLPRNLHEVYLDLAKDVAHSMQGGRQLKGESDSAYNNRIRKMAADGLLRVISPGKEDLIVRVPTSLEISTALRFVTSKRVLAPGDPIQGISVNVMIEILDSIKIFRLTGRVTDKLGSILRGTTKLITTHPSFPAELQKEKLRREKVETSALSALFPSEGGSSTDVLDV